MVRMAELIGSEFVRHACLADAEACSGADRAYYPGFVEQSKTAARYTARHNASISSTVTR